MKQPNERTIFSGFLTLKESHITTRSGNLPYYTIHTRPFSVIILAFDDREHLLITREKRHAVGKVVYSLPGGLVEEGEEILAAAQRELLEETGLEARDYSVLGHFYPLPGLLAQTTTIVTARNIRKVQEQSTDPFELISYEFLPLQVIQKLLLNNTDVDAISVAALGLHLMASSLENGST